MQIRLFVIVFPQVAWNFDVQREWTRETGCEVQDILKLYATVMLRAKQDILLEYPPCIYPAVNFVSP